MKCPFMARFTPFRGVLRWRVHRFSVKEICMSGDDGRGEEADQAFDVDLVFTKANLRDVVPHDNDPVVILVVT